MKLLNKFDAEDTLPYTTVAETLGFEHLNQTDKGRPTPLTDHLGSTSIKADGATGAKQSELRYKPWGELRYASQPTTTGLRFTGQRMEGIGLYAYGAHWYDQSGSSDSMNLPGPGRLQFIHLATLTYGPTTVYPNQPQ